MSSDPTLRELRADFGRHRFLAMPIAGTIAWAVAGALGAVLPAFPAAMALFVCTGLIFPLGVLVGRVLGEDMFGREGGSNELDRLFLLTVFMAWLAFAIAIPFFLVEPTSLPLSVGILAGLMWVPFSWMIQHWVGLFHGVARTALVVATWYLLPAQRFVAIPAVIVIIYLITIGILVKRRVPAASPEPKKAE